MNTHQSTTSEDEEKKSLDASPPEAVLYDDLEKHAIDFSSEMKGIGFVGGESSSYVPVVETAGMTGDEEERFEVGRPTSSLPRKR